MTHYTRIKLGENGPALTASVTLADRNNAYGVRRANDDVVVVEAGEDVPHVGGGVYELDIGQYLTAGVAYESVLRVAWASGDVDYYDNPFTVADDTPAGYYGTLQDVYNAVGKTNADRYSNIDAAGLDLDAGRMATIMGQVDDQIDFVIGTYGFGRPDKQAQGFSLLSQGFGLMVAALNYKARGDLETTGDAKGRTNAETWASDGRALVLQWAYRQQSQDVASQILFCE